MCARYNKKEDDVKLNDSLPMIRINKLDKEDIKKALQFLENMGASMDLTDFCRTVIIEKTNELIGGKEYGKFYQSRNKSE